MSHSNLSQYEQNEYGHPSVESGDLTTMNKKMIKKCIENVLSGRWPAETPAELEALRAHKERKKSNA